MTTTHYPGSWYRPSPVDEPQLIAAFGDMQSARAAVSDLDSLPVDADIIITPRPGAVQTLPAAGLQHERSNRTTTGALFGAVWGMLMAALFINFLAVNPSIITVGGLTIFGTVGGMAIGGFIAGVNLQEGREQIHSFNGTDDPDVKAFVTVHGESVEDIDAAHRLLERRRALDVYRA